ncbi:hypothetical protein GIB67_037649, partial [Kingdonia uniflora]
FSHKAKMKTMFLSEMKKKASGFIQEKCKTARLVFTDVTLAELLAEEATSNEPNVPDAKTMTRIAEASFDIDDYWRVVDVLHRRFYTIDWKQWRQSYKALVLLEFLLTHGPEDFAEEFQCDTDVIEDLGTFRHIDEKGFNWGANMQKKSERILKLLTEGPMKLKEARLKALKITKEIQGFGNLMASPSSSISSSSAPSSPWAYSTGASRSSSFGSYSTNSSTWGEMEETKQEHHPNKILVENYSEGGLPGEKPTTLKAINEHVEGVHLWDCPIEETGSLLDNEEDEDEVNDPSEGIYSKLCMNIPSKCDNGRFSFRSLSDSGKVLKKKIDRQFSMGY